MSVFWARVAEPGRKNPSTTWNFANWKDLEHPPLLLLTFFVSRKHWEFRYFLSVLGAAKADLLKLHPLYWLARAKLGHYFSLISVASVTSIANWCLAALAWPVDLCSFLCFVWSEKQIQKFKKYSFLFLTTFEWQLISYFWWRYVAHNSPIFFSVFCNGHFILIQAWS